MISRLKQRGMLLNPFRFQSGAELWTPDNLATPVKIWLDWSTLPSSGSQVSEWANKGTLDTKFIQDSAGRRPSVESSTTIGKNVVVFDGVDDQLYADLPAFMRLAPAAWVFAVYRRRGSDLNHRRLLSVVHDFPGFGYSRFTAFISGEASLGGLAPWLQTEGVDGGSEVNTTETSSFPVTQWGVHYFERNYAGGSAGIWSDGEQKASTTGQPMAPSTDKANSRVVSIGATPHVISQLADMDLACLISDDQGALPSSERQKLEGWAAHQAGIASVLPSGHPYKLAPPLV